MNWRETLSEWMLQICAVDLWRHCQCGYFHFYDAMLLMKRSVEKSGAALESTEAFSLAAACVLLSFSKLHKKTTGMFALQNVLVHRLQRAELDKLDYKVTFDRITRALERMDRQVVSEWLDVEQPKQQDDDRTSERLFLDMLDYISGKENVNPPRAPMSHSLCMSEGLCRADDGIKVERLVELSEEIVMRVLENNSTAEDQQIWRKTHMDHPADLRLRMESSADEVLPPMRYHLKQIIMFRKLHKFLPRNFVQVCEELVMRMIEGTFTDKDHQIWSETGMPRPEVQGFQRESNDKETLERMCNSVKKVLTFKELHTFLDLTMDESSKEVIKGMLKDDSVYEKWQIWQERQITFPCAPTGIKRLQRMCNNVKQVLAFRELHRFLPDIQCLW